MKKKVFKIGFFVCLFIVAIFMIVYCLVERHISKTTMNNVTLIETSENVKFYVESVSYDEKGVACIKAAAENNDILYDYFNWTGGPGTQPYKNWTIVLTDGKDIIYKLKSFTRSYTSEDDTINQLSSTGNGIVAYVQNNELAQNKNLKIAILFKDRSDNSYLLYPEEDTYL